MIAKIRYETVHGNVGLGADTTEFEHFKTFEDLLEWSKKTAYADDYRVIISAANRRDFTNGSTIVILDTEPIYTYLDGTGACQRDVVTAEFFGGGKNLSYAYFTGYAGTIVTCSDGRWANTSWNIEAGLPDGHEFPSGEAGDFCNSLVDEAFEAQNFEEHEGTAFEFALNCVDYKHYIFESDRDKIRSQVGDDEGLCYPKNWEELPFGIEPDAEELIWETKEVNSNREKIA